MTKYKVRGRGGGSGKIKVGTQRLALKDRKSKVRVLLQVILEEAHNLLESQEGILWGQGIECKTTERYRALYTWREGHCHMIMWKHVFQFHMLQPCADGLILSGSIPARSLMGYHYLALLQVYGCV